MKNWLRLILALVFLFALALAGFTATNVAADSPMYHIVSWGDTLFSIANKYGTSVNAVMQANGIRNSNFIYVGQRLTIPGGNILGPLPNPTTYVVQNGDTLFSIATRHSTSVNALMQANGLQNYWIFVGQVLRIPGYAPQPIPIPQPLPIGTYYVVRPGDYLAAIAYRFGTNVYAIQIANRLANSNFIWVGQRLFIPGGVGPMPGPIPNPFPGPMPGPLPFPPEPIPGPLPYPPYAPPTATPVVIILPSPVPNPNATSWEAVLITNTRGTGPCSLAAIVVGKTNWPVVVATTDGSFISDPKLTGTKPERGPYVVEFAHACTGTWRVIPLGLNVYADVTLNGGHAEVEFHPRP
ncbi:MAG: LysM peptidoglycan-binding domain-containing protein [Chloroflexi bacterium]|nr:LysM peptidoglycan-binding domain-containing protein [Chloroflexota bacterium]